MISAVEIRRATGITSPGSQKSRQCLWERTNDAAAVPPNEGNEVRWDGSKEVGTLHSTSEAGEHAPVDPVEERESRFAEPLWGKTMGTSSPTDVSTKLQRVAVVECESVNRGAGCVNRARPDPWEPGESDLPGPPNK